MNQNRLHSFKPVTSPEQLKQSLEHSSRELTKKQNKNEARITEELIELYVEDTARTAIADLEKPDRKIRKEMEAAGETFRMKYPKDAMLVNGIRTLRRNKASANMPSSVQEACMVLAAAFTKAIPYYDRYELYQQSVKVTDQDLADAYKVASYDQIRPEMRNKLDRARKEADKRDQAEQLTLKDFINHQARHMDTWTDDELETVEKIEEVVLDLEVDPAEIQTWLTPTVSTDPNYFLTTAELCRYLITMSKGMIQLFPTEAPKALKAEGFQPGEHPDGRKGWFALMVKNV